MNEKKNDVVLIVLVLAFAAVFLIGMTWKKTDADSAQAVVTLDGQEYGRYPLSEDCTVEIAAGEEKWNVLVIKDNAVEMTEASCPDKICVHHKKISGNNETIVCLPNKVVVVIEDAKKTEIDILTH